MFITATLANFSNSLYKIYCDNIELFQDSIIYELLTEQITAYYHVIPSESYIGPSWFKNTPDVYKELDITNLYKTIYEIPNENKKLTLIVVSNRIKQQKDLSERLLRLGYNVIVELNSENNRNYTIKYDVYGKTKIWNIPYKELSSCANNGDLKTYTTEDGIDIKTGIESINDLSLSHILQATLKLGTNDHSDIISSISQDEKYKLLTIFMRMKFLTNKRPDDYPRDVKIALIAGNLASRGISIQNQLINFTCTSFVFSDTKDTAQRGAINSQRFGRACGILKEVFIEKPNSIKPILIATPEIMKAALANEAIINKKAENSGNGEFICVKDFITKKDWKECLNDISKIMKPTKPEKKIINRIEVSNTKPNNIPIITEFNQYNNIEFMEKFKITSIPIQSIELNRLLKSKNIQSNISFQLTSAKEVSNIANYYNYSNWASGEYHIIKLSEDEKFTIIRKDKKLLDSNTLKTFAAHNYIGQYVTYTILS